MSCWKGLFETLGHLPAVRPPRRPQGPHLPNGDDKMIYLLGWPSRSTGWFMQSPRHGTAQQGCCCGVDGPWPLEGSPGSLAVGSTAVGPKAMLSEGPGACPTRRKQTLFPGPQPTDLRAQRCEKGQAGSRERPLNQTGNLRDAHPPPHFCLLRRKNISIKIRERGFNNRSGMLSWFHKSILSR